MSRRTKTPPDYRYNFFKANPGRKIAFRSEPCYKCKGCGKWFPKSQITVDHRIPIRKGGTHDLWNLQPMCDYCNKHKSKNNTRWETFVTLCSAFKHGHLLRALWFIRKRKIKDFFGIGYDRDNEGW